MRRFVRIVVLSIAGMASALALFAAAPAAGAAGSTAENPPYNPTLGHELVAEAAAVAGGRVDWDKGCTKNGCIPYSWAAGHKTIGPSYGNCGGYPEKYDPCKAPSIFGLDCSGFTRFVYYLVYGKDILKGGITSTQPTQSGMKPVTPADAEPGDLIYFPAGHVGIYAGVVKGKRMMIDEPHPGLSAREESINGWGKARYYRYLQFPAAFYVNAQGGVGEPWGEYGLFTDVKENTNGRLTAYYQNPYNEPYNLSDVTGTLSPGGAITFSYIEMPIVSPWEWIDTYTGTVVQHGNDLTMSGTYCVTEVAPQRSSCLPSGNWLGSTVNYPPSPS